ncbi:MAG: GNAT family N-acetyltransferase [Candidatus Methanomethylicaceae archaeon]
MATQENSKTFLIILDAKILRDQNLFKIVEADEEALERLSRTLLKILEDKEGEIYQENVAKFEIPEEYVRKAFSEDSLLKARNLEKAKFYLVMEENGEEIVGFAQTIMRNEGTVELDRIIIFPEFTRKGLGSKLLQHVLNESKKRGFKKVIVNTGKDEIRARRFYEKNGFEKLEEYVVDTPWGKKLELVCYQFSF